MTTCVDQALIYLVDLRMRVRHIPEAREVVDRCLALLAAADTANPAAVARAEAEVEALRRDLLRRFGPAKPIIKH